MSVEQIYLIPNCLVLHIANGFPMYLVKANVFIGMKTIHKGVSVKCHLAMKKSCNGELASGLLIMPAIYS